MATSAFARARISAPIARRSTPFERPPAINTIGAS
jgi:hypothetical protein